MSLSDRAREFDSDGEIKRSVERAQQELVSFRMVFPFDANPEAIDSMSEQDVYDPGSGQEYFFKWLEYKLRPLGGYNIGSSRVYENARSSADQFKRLLHIAVSEDLNLAEKIDADWESIPGMGGDKLIAKKIVSAYDDRVLPVFKTELLEHFFCQIIGKRSLPPTYESMSVGQRFEFLTGQLLNERERFPETSAWSIPYYGRFLHNMYPLSEKERTREQEPVSPDQLRGYGLLFTPVMHEEVVFLFSKLHEKIGFPLIMKIQQAFPDVYAIDASRKPKRIEIETLASQFDHNPADCDVIVCWENDLEQKPEGWPEVIQLRDYL